MGNIYSVSVYDILLSMVCFNFLYLLFPVDKPCEYNNQRRSLGFCNIMKDMKVIFHRQQINLKKGEIGTKPYFHFGAAY
jgi:hypothetical protein